MKKLISFTLGIFLVFSSVSFADVRVKAIGEADIINGDKTSARLIAVARAKWAALESVAGAKIKSDTVLQNAVLVDESIKTEVDGVIKSFDVIGEEEDGSIYRVQISADVEKTKAEAALGLVSRNTSVAVMLPVVFPDGRVEEFTAFSEAVISGLSMRDMEVTDMTSAEGFDIAEIEKAIKTNDYNELRSVAVKNLSNTILIGKVETAVTAREGIDIGYGVSLPFNIVTGRLTYRLVTEKHGSRAVLASGYIPVRGQGTTVEDATFRMTENLRDSASAALVSIVLEKIKGVNSRLVNVRIMGSTSPERLLELKALLTHTSWVLEVRDVNASTLSVTYPEKTLYLAASMDGRSGFKVEKYSDYELVISSR